jgi:hypothetical protein
MHHQDTRYHTSQLFFRNKLLDVRYNRRIDDTPGIALQRQHVVLMIFSTIYINLHVFIAYQLGTG